MFYGNDPIPFTDSLEISDSKVDLAPPLLSIGSSFPEGMGRKVPVGKTFLGLVTFMTSIGIEKSAETGRWSENLLSLRK